MKTGGCAIRNLFYGACPRPLQKFWHRIESSAIASRLVRGSFWSFFGAVVSRLLSLAAFVVIARVLGKETYGQFGVVQSTISMFAVFAGFGLGQTSTKYVAELRETDPLRAGRIMGMTGLVALLTGTSFAALLYIFAPWLAETTLAAPDLASALRIGAFIMMFEAMNGAQVGALAGFEAFRTTAVISVWAGIFSFPAMVVGVYLGGLEGGVLGLLFSRIFNWLLNHMALRRQAKRAGIPFVFKGTKSDFEVLWKFSLPAMLSGVMVSPILWVCNAILVNQPNGYAQMGIFHAASSFKHILLFIGSTLGAPLLPMLANMSGKKSERFSKVNILSTWFLGSISGVILLGCPEMAQSVFGKDFAGADFAKTFSLIVLSASIVIYKQGLARVLAAYGLMWWGMLSNMLWAAVLVISTWALISWGAVGYASAYVVAYATNTIIFIPLYTRKGLIPRNTLISMEAGGVWGILSVGVLLNLCAVTLPVRLIYIPFAVVLICWFFYRLFKK